MSDWPEIARCFSVLRPSQWINAEVRLFLDQLADEQEVLVACSGGADSVFLVLTAWSILGSERIHVAHFNHGIRGAEADADARFVAELADSLKLGYSQGELKNPDDQSEAALRDARYRWLFAVYQERQSSGLLLGHHADDLLETQIIAMLSGAGPAGLCSPMPVRKFPDGHIRVRPLLSMKRSTIEKTLTSLSVPWREDASNTDTRYTRNWIRLKLMPILEKNFPQDVHAGSSRTRTLMQDAVDAMDWALRKLDLDLSDPCGFHVGGLQSTARGIIRRALFAWWIQHYDNDLLPTAAADKIIEIIYVGELHHPVSIGTVAGIGSSAQCIMINADGELTLQPEETAKPRQWRLGCHWVVDAGPIWIPSGACLEGEQVCWDQGEMPYLDANPSETAWLGNVTGPIYVRQWRAGDRYRPLGAPGTRKLQDIFSDAKLNPEQKQALPVLLNNKGEILWVPGFPPAESAKVLNESNSALRLTYRTLSTAFK